MKKNQSTFISEATQKAILLLMMLFIFSANLTAQNQEPEKADPQIGLDITRKLDYIDIEGEKYQNVTISIQSKGVGLIYDYYRVKVKIEDSCGKKIYKNTFKNAFLYIFSSGDIYIGRKNFKQLLVTKLNPEDGWFCMVREKEGIY